MEIDTLLAYARAIQMPVIYVHSLNCPNYQVSPTEMQYYNKSLQIIITDSIKHEHITYLKCIPFFQNDFIAVVNNTSVVESLANYYTHEKACAIIAKYKEGDKVDEG
eukprot:12993573-Ditylum_brightwellii.AAC.1